MKRYLLALAALFILHTAAFAQEFWEKDPYTTWTKEQCTKLLHDSPWAKTFTISTVKQDRFGQPTKGESRQSEQRIFYHAQLRSALPVRQAVVRLSQLHNKYEKMADTDKKAFDSVAQRYLNAEYPDILIHVEYESDVEFFDKDLANHWQTRQEKEMLNASVYLTTSKGVRIVPVGFKTEQGAGRAFEFRFPRTIDGVEIISSAVDSIRVEFPNPPIRDLNDPRTTFEFRTNKMKYRGAVIY